MEGQGILSLFEKESSDSLLDKKAFARAITAVEHLLKIRLRSEHELRARLTDKGFANNVIDSVIRRYAESGIIDDNLFAEQWIKSRQKKPFGQKRIQYELILKGVDKVIIEHELNAAWQDFEEKKIVAELAQKRVKKYKSTLDKQKIKQRLYAYLSRRGFSPEAIFNALKNYEN